MSRGLHDKSLLDVLPPEQVPTILAEKVRRSRAKTDRLIADLGAEVADRARQQAGAAARAARRARLAAAGVLKKG